MQLETIFYIIVLVYSIVLHEIAHGVAAFQYGDKTASYQGRLSLNPLVHIDWLGSVLIPVVLILSQAGLLFGWAKPVPVNEANLNPYKMGKFMVSIAGVVTNFLLGLTFILIANLLDSNTYKELCYIVALTNFSLCFFNLLPIPPADGYRILEVFLPFHINRKINDFIYQNYLIVMVAAIFVASRIFGYIFPIINSMVFKLIFT